jgi:hypothetical protein
MDADLLAVMIAKKTNNIDLRGRYSQKLYILTVQIVSENSKTRLSTDTGKGGTSFFFLSFLGLSVSLSISR